MGLMDRLLNGGEYKILIEMSAIAEIAKKANEELRNLTKSSGTDVSKIKNFERESDKKVFKISELIASGAVAPNVLSDMLNLVDTEDDIVDYIFNLARDMTRYNLPDKKIADMVKNDILATTDLVDSAVDLLAKMENSSDLNRIHDFRKQIEDLEHKEDDIKDGLIDYVYKNNVDFKTFNYIIEVAHKCDDILDRCEDSADIFMSIMSAIMT